MNYSFTPSERPIYKIHHVPSHIYWFSLSSIPLWAAIPRATGSHSNKNPFFIRLMCDYQAFIKGSDSKDYQPTTVTCVSAISPRAPPDPVQCMSRLMTLLLVILLSGEELFWNKQRIPSGNIQMLLWTHWDKHFNEICAHTIHSEELIKVSIHRHGGLLMHW